jgi:hypothetical protein
MARGTHDQNWKQKVLAWRASGKSGSAWSKENQIPYTTLLGWKRRFENSTKERPLSNAESSKAFIELKDQPISNSGTYSGVTLEHQGIKIRLETGFNPVVLKQCLACLGGVSC